jgi:hypothetical protein
MLGIPRGFCWLPWPGVCLVVRLPPKSDQVLESFSRAGSLEILRFGSQDFQAR